jgi:hypothetical protein
MKTERQRLRDIVPDEFKVIANHRPDIIKTSGGQIVYADNMPSVMQQSPA